MKKLYLPRLVKTKFKIHLHFTLFLNLPIAVKRPGSFVLYWEANFVEKHTQNHKGKKSIVIIRIKNLFFVFLKIILAKKKLQLSEIFILVLNLQIIKAKKIKIIRSN